MKEYLTVCPRNCYSTCSFRVFTENNRIVRILPDHANNATPEGPCIKGLSYIERATSEERLTEPLLRSPSGRMKVISYNDAIEIIASKLSDIAGKNLHKSLLYYTGSGMSGLTNEIGYNFFRLFGGATTTYGNFCWPAGLEAVRLTLGDIKSSAPWELLKSKLIVIWGKNPAETNIQETIFIEKASASGAKIVVIDPRITPTAEKADILYSPKPGSDGALALAIAGIIIREGWADKEFLEDHVSGFAEFSKSLTISPEEAEKITGIESDEIYRLARMIATIKPVTIISGYGLQRYTNGGQTIRSLLALCVITGNIGRSGSGFNYATINNYVFDTLKEPLSYYPWLNPDPLFRREVSMARLGRDLLKVRDPELKIAWIERGNPVTQAPNTARVLKAFRKMDFRIVVDQFLTDTAAEADLVLPAKNMFEQQDVVCSYWSPYVCYRPAILKPPGSVKPESEIFFDLAVKMGIGFESCDIPSPGKENMDAWLENRISGFTNLTLDDLIKEKKIAPGYQEIAYSDMKFNTPSGKVELYSDEARRLWNIDELPAYKPAFTGETANREKDGAGAFIFLTPNSRNRIHSQFGNLRVIKQIDPEPLLQINDSDARMLEIENRDFVRISNDRGSIIVRANITTAIARGVVSMPNGWWISEGGGGNLLSEGRETDIGHGTAFHDNIVYIKKAEK